MFVHPTAIIDENVKIGEGTKVWHYVHIRENAKIGKNCVLGKDVYIDKNVKIGDNVKVQNRVSIFDGVIVEDGVLISPHVCFTNDKIPRAINPDGSLKSGDDWKIGKTLVKRGASIGANSTILPNVTIGEFALVGACSVVTKDVPAYGLVYGNPAKLYGYVCKCGRKGEVRNGILKCEACNEEIKIENDSSS